MYTQGEDKNMYKNTSDYKRNESFRFNFSPFIPVDIEISMRDDETLEKVRGKGELMNLSLNGARIKTSLPIPKLKTVEVKLTFTLDQSPLDVSGSIIWTKHFEYGLQFHSKESMKKLIFDEIKMYARKKK